MLDSASAATEIMAVMSFFKDSQFMTSANAITRIDQLRHRGRALECALHSRIPDVPQRCAARNGRGYVATATAIEESDRLFVCRLRVCRGGGADDRIARALHRRGDQHEPRCGWID